MKKGEYPMRMTKMIAVAAALSMAASPALAAPAGKANPAAKLSITKNVRASSSAKGSSALADGPSTLTALFLGGLVVAGVVVAATSGDDKPDSN
jgi:hypothetical protein